MGLLNRRNGRRLWATYPRNLQKLLQSRWYRRHLRRHLLPLRQQMQLRSLLQQSSQVDVEDGVEAAKKREAKILAATYSPEVEADRKRREQFYLGLGVNGQDAKRLVARILDAYA